MAVNLSAIKDLLLPGLRGIEGKYEQIPSQYDKIFTKHDSKMALEYNASVGGDGVALVSASHPIDGSTISNYTTNELNESTLLNAMIAIRTNFKDQAGLKVFARGRKLIVPAALEPVAIRLTKTELRPGTADNDVNAIMMTAGGLPEGYMVNDFLTSASAWFLLTNIDGLSYMERVKFETDMQVDFVTDNLLVKGYERYSFGYYNWRSIYGAIPS